MITQIALKITFIAAILVSLAAGGLAQEPDQRDNFAKAYSLYTTGSYAEAQELFTRTVETNAPLADYSLYYLALIAFQQDDWDTSEHFLARLRDEYPQSIWYDAAELQRAKIAIAEEKYPQGINRMRSLRAQKDLSHDISEEALYLQAQAEEMQGDVYQAYSLYQQLRSFAPLSAWTALARKRVAQLRDQYPAVFGIVTVTAIADEADRLVTERQFGAAESLYKKLLDIDMGPELRLQFLTKLSDLYLSVRKRNEATSVLERIAADYPDSREAPKALYRIGRILWNRNDNGDALRYFARLMERYPKAPQAARAQFAMADIYESQDKNDEAAALYSTLPKKFPASQVRDDSIWRLAWLHYRAREWQAARETFGLLTSQARQGKYKTAAKYWQARTAERLGENDAAIRLYRKIIADGEDDSYYHGLAAQELEKEGVTIAEPTTEIEPNNTGSDPPVSGETAFHLIRARALAQLNLHDLAVRELEEIRRRNQPQGPLRLLLIREFAKNQAYANSVQIANQLPASAAGRDLYRFPLAHWDAVKDRARARGMDPYLIIALIRQESLFDNHARSPAAALGLMQLLPSTARRVAAQIGITVPSNEALFDPELNLTLGTQYLKDLLQRYSNNWFKAIAAYNAGEAAVDRWNETIATDDTAEFVEQIPYRETRQYVKLVIRNHRIYKRLYDHQK
jgi:soluble lytic murein transglycosylase